MLYALSELHRSCTGSTHPRPYYYCCCSGQCGAQKRAICLGGVPDIASSSDRHVAGRRVLGHGHNEGVSVQDTHSHCWMARTGGTCSLKFGSKVRSPQNAAHGDEKKQQLSYVQCLDFWGCPSAPAVLHAAQSCMLRSVARDRNGFYYWQ